MSATTLLAKRGLLPFDEYLEGADELHDLAKPTSDSDVSSLVTYYQMLQVKGVTQQQYRTVTKRSNEENIKSILSLLDENDTVLLGFYKDGWGGHAILAYDYENGSWTKNGVVYDGRIKICDPNSSDKDSEDNYVYYSTKTYAWEIPAYAGSGISSDKGAVFNYIGADIDEINLGGWLSGTEANNANDHVARINAFSISDNRYVSKVQIGANGNYTMMNNAPGDIVEDVSYVLGNESEGIVGYDLYDANASYCITQGSTEKLETAIQYKDSLLVGGTSAGKSIVFDKSGYVEVHGSSSDYAMSITADGEHPTDWFAVTVKGSGADLSSFKQVDDGWVVTSDNLNNVEVTVNNKYDVASTTFTTEYPSALIYEIDENTIGIAVDRDDNGTYETTLETKTTSNASQDPLPDDTTGTCGDLDGDGDITASDALLILRSSAGMESFTPEQITLGDVDGDGDITANDALAVLRYSAGVDDDGNIGKKTA